MAVIRYEPIHFAQALDKYLEQFSRSSRDGSNVETSHWNPAVDIKEETDRFVLYADLPGVDKNNIEIAMENNVLTIRGERNEIHRDEKDSYSRIERVSGTFYRRFTLPDTADSEKISAKTSQGVLEVVIPKKTVAQPRRIEVKD